MKLNLEEGTLIIKHSRNVLEQYLKGEEPNIQSYPDKFKNVRGIFVSLHTYPEHDLRGCIGIPEPIMSLVDAIKETSISAAVHDPRFQPLTHPELKDTIIEVSVLTTPEDVDVKDPREYLEKLKVGRDGLIIEFGPYRGLLLPQVATEYNWDTKQFLSNLCLKAGLPVTAWTDYDVKIKSFQAQVFEELVPGGPVVEKSTYTGC
ncbi:AMMECR1 domain protein [Methanococcus maripaludis C5]|uniref:Protein MmarC5_1061 n=1 Tax=Methanococcus maripaludis (strain C5 / ATCC BAA-1333) TaxID=402880 RepID=A4FYT0_METM5|nr:TIGR00296 family protein [Methanococcus maripaludis]ABO35364.1 AMMECR1 domain protein [Methanococcus maripaludis C5]